MKKFILFLIVAVLLVSVFYGFNPPKTEIPETPDEPENLITETKEESNKKTVSLFFASANTLSAEKRQIELKSENDIYKAVIEELIKGPSVESLSVTINPGTVVNSVTVNNKIATADFTDSLKKLNTGGSTKEYLCLYSIVNTLCDFDEIDSVIITINGNQVETFGQLDTSEPIFAE